MKYIDGYYEDIKRVIYSIPRLEEIKKKQIVIVGASGLIGSTVADILFYLNREYGYNIDIVLTGRDKEKITRRFKIYEEDKDYRFIRFDVNSDTCFDEKGDYYIYGASNCGPRYFASLPVETLNANIAGLNSVLACAAKNNNTKVVYISSSEVYGICEKDEPLFETDMGTVDILDPRSCYPSGKRAGETLCASYSSEYDLFTLIVRPGHIYGPQTDSMDYRAPAQFARNALNHEDIVMKSSGSQLRSYCFSLDCASAIIAVMINGESSNAYNISNKKSIVTVKNLAQEFAKAGNVHLVYEDADLQEKSGFGKMVMSALNSDKIENIGWKASFSLEEGVKRTLLYYEP